MKGFSPVALILGLLIIGLGSWFLSERFCGASGPGFAVNDGNFNASSPDTYSFLVGKAGIKMTDGTNKSFKLIADYLKKNELKTLSLTGTHFAGEKGDDLGTARAMAVKNKLVKSFKAPEDRISVGGQVLNNKAIGKTIPGGVEFVFGGGDASTGVEKKTDVEAGTIDAGIGGLNRTYLFPSGEVKLNFDSEMKDYVTQLNSYLSDNPGSKIAVMGYTDKAGRESANIKSSTEMARLVRRFFRTDDRIASKAIFHEGKGSAIPENANADVLNNGVLVFIQE